MKAILLGVAPALQKAPSHSRKKDARTQSKKKIPTKSQTRSQLLIYIPEELIQ